MSTAPENPTHRANPIRQKHNSRFHSAAMQGGREMSVVAGASCATSTPVSSSLSTQAWGISVLTGTRWTSVSSASAAPKETDTETELWEEDWPIVVESDEWYE